MAKLSKNAVQMVATSRVWHYFGKEFSFPRWNNIAFKVPAEQGEFANAQEIFEEMKLDLAKLAEIFPKRVMIGPMESMPVASTPKTYNQLGSCAVVDIDKWIKLAKLTGKTIHFVYCHDEEHSGEQVAIYYPSGKYEAANHIKRMHEQEV